ncbi:MAG TPA: hypothetical protein VMF61_10715 [Candidatus Acidoferrales bacterium]|nr:hypothetical protein [Candidatus Acidoferrales bacterium]
MFLSPALGAALDRIAERAADLRRAYTPGAVPANDDVALASPSSEFTLDPLATVPSENEYFIVRGDDGSTAYDRDGAFRLEAGRLVAESGKAVLGRSNPDAPLTELHVDPVDAALGRAANVRVERDGSLVYDRRAIDPRTGLASVHRVVAGRIALARFPAGTRLVGLGSEGSAPNGVAAHVGLPGDGTFTALQPHRRQRSRIDVDESVAKLKEAYLAFDALQAAHGAKGRTAKTAMDLLK